MAQPLPEDCSYLRDHCELWGLSAKRAKDYCRRSG